jgi:hypothetical protein
MKLKSIIYIISILSVVVVSTSCTKEYTCRCTVTYNGVPGLVSETRDYYIRDFEKKAKETCEGNSQTYTYDAITTVEDCKLW